MRPATLVVCCVLAACAPEPAPNESAAADPTSERWYRQTLGELVAIDRQALALFQAGKSDDAADLIVKGETFSKRLLSVSRPTLAAAEAAADLDELYGKMLFSNRNYGWARIMFQKNLARWKHWTPGSPDTATRLARAEAEIADCDRAIDKHIGKAPGSEKQPLH